MLTHLVLHACLSLPMQSSRSLLDTQTWSTPTVITGKKFGWAAIRQEESAADGIEAHVAAAGGSTLRGLLSTAAWMHLSLAHGKNVDFANGGLTSQQENTEDSIAAEMMGASGRGSGRKVLFDQSLLRPSLAQGKQVDFLMGASTHSRQLQTTTSMLICPMLQARLGLDS